MFALIARDGYISIEDLAEKYHYSRSTISKSLKTAKAYLEKYNCQLVSRPAHGLRVEGSEGDRRICLLFSKKIANHMGKLLYSPIPDFQQLFDREKCNYPAVALMIRGIFQDYNVCIPRPYNELVRMILFFNCRKRDYVEFQPLNTAQTSLINGHADMVESVSRMNAEELIRQIAEQAYPH